MPNLLSALRQAGRSFRDTEQPDAITLVVFGAIPFVLIAGRGDALTGATGIFPLDQLQYLAWIRDLGDHALARNSFDLAASSRVFTNPLFATSGGLVRVGISPAVAYLAWLPVAAVALWAAFRAYVRRLLRAPGERTAALVLALFAASPLAAALGLLVGLGSASHNQLALAVADATPALQLWGYFPIAIALALVCVCFLAVERSLDAEGKRDGALAIAAASAALASWIHPWQGATIVAVVGALALLERTRRATVACGAVALAALVPLAYYYLLPHLDHAWHAARAQNHLSLAPWIVPAVLVPLAVPAVLGVRRNLHDAQERILLIWPLAALALYLIGLPYALHALETASLPLAILAVRGFRRLNIGRRTAVALLVLAVAPGLVFAMGLLRREIDQRPAAYSLKDGDARALDLVARSAAPGGVLAPTPLAGAVPARTGRQTWLGHPTWTPRFRQRERDAKAFFAGRMPSSGARRFARDSGAAFVIAPCGSSPTLERLLGNAALSSSVRVGCARVITLRTPNGAIGANR